MAILKKKLDEPTETWIDELLKRFPDCPNPINYPKSAKFYLETRS